jgi:SPP1 family phage portal protein
MSNSYDLIKYGREQIFTSLEPTLDNIPQILNDAIPIFEANAQDSETLNNMYKGKQEILEKEKTVRPTINNKVVENHALEITDFKTGYVFGDTVQYVKRGKDLIGEASKVEDVAMLNQYMDEAFKATADIELANWVFRTGAGFRCVLPYANDIGFAIDTYSPLDTFVIYSNAFGKEPLVNCKYTTYKKTDGTEWVRLGVYTKAFYIEIEYETVVAEIKAEHLSDPMNNPVGLPIIEYQLNVDRMGCFEPVISILNTLNSLSSSRVDGVEQFVQAFVKFVNCELDEDAKATLAELGFMQVKSQPGVDADIEIMSSELNQTQVQTLVDFLYQRMLVICSMPDRNASAGGNTGTSMEIGQGWISAEAWAKSFETIFDRSEKRFLEVALKIMNDSKETDLNNLSLSEVDIKFTRSKLNNMMVKAQTGMNLMEMGIHPRTVIETMSLFSDPENVFIESEPYLKEAQERKKSEQTMGENPIKTQSEGENPTKNTGE